CYCAFGGRLMIWNSPGCQTKVKTVRTIGCGPPTRSLSMREQLVDRQSESRLLPICGLDFFVPKEMVGARSSCRRDFGCGGHSKSNGLCNDCKAASTGGALHCIGSNGY